MKTAMKFLICFITAVSIMAFTSCSKDEIEGPIGPQGQQGEQGIQGQDGAEGPAGQDGEGLGVPGPAGTNGTNGTDGVDGANGADGEDGNANVIASDWFGPTGQTFVTNGYTRYAEFDKNIVGLDSELYDNGTLLVYAHFINYVPQVWPEGHSAQLPLTISGGTTDHIYTYYFSPTNLKVRYRQEGPEDSWSFDTASRFRYIAIPSNLTGKNKNDFSKMTYEEVIIYFGLSQ